MDRGSRLWREVGILVQVQRPLLFLAPAAVLIGCNMHTLPLLTALTLRR